MEESARADATNKGVNVREFLERFWRFDKLMGGSLVKAAYYLGLIGIGLWLVAAIVTAVEVAGYSGDAAAGGLLFKFVIAAVAVVFWRFTCELSLLAFHMFDRLGEIRDRLPPR